MAKIFDHRERLRARFVADMGKTMSDWDMTKLLCSYALPPEKYQEKYKEQNFLSVNQIYLSGRKAVNSIFSLKMI